MSPKARRQRSPDGSTIAFSTQRDDCGLVRADGTGRLGINPRGVVGAGLPDWR